MRRAKKAKPVSLGSRGNASAEPLENWSGLSEGCEQRHSVDETKSSHTNCLCFESSLEAQDSPPTHPPPPRAFLNRDHELTLGTKQKGSRVRPEFDSHHWIWICTTNWLSDLGPATSPFYASATSSKNGNDGIDILGYFFKLNEIPHAKHLART